MKDEEIDDVVKILRKECKKWHSPIVTEVSRERSPFKVLISCVISLRTKDEVTSEASRRLFSLADTPQKMALLEIGEIERAIYPAGFYRIKARNIKGICNRLLEDNDGIVPDSLEELLKLPGVGRKTANLVLTLGYGKPGICVDTHVHRIMNRLGYVATKTPEQTEFVLREKLPVRYWLEINDLLVTYGQNLCTPVSPFCSRCMLYPYCQRVNVKKSR